MNTVREPMAVPHHVPYEEIDAVCIDVGGTLLGIDFNWVSEELERLGVACAPEALARAEAAARPRVSERLYSGDPPDDTFAFFLGSTLTNALPVERHAIIPDLVFQLAPVLLPDGKGQRLWSAILSGTSDVLNELSQLGLRLAVVSNSDGMLEEGLKGLGLRRFFDAVIDSEIVGYAKPDPRIFEVALHAIGTAAARTVHVGDMYFADIIGARRAGLHAVLLDPFGDWGHVDCVRMASLTELSAALRRSQASRSKSAV